MTVEKGLLQRINQKKEKMIQIGIDKGLTSVEVIECSQELDYLLNILMEKEEAKAYGVA